MDFQKEQTKAIKQCAAAMAQKYETYVSNLRWNLKNNKVDEVETNLINHRIDGYLEIISDLKKFENIYVDGEVINL